jgi:Ca2+-binding EF-hand superfamily protein
LSKKDILEIKEAFDSYDKHKSGLLTPNDLKEALYEQNFFATSDTVYSLIAEYDVEGFGRLTF